MENIPEGYQSEYNRRYGEDDDFDQDEAEMEDDLSDCCGAIIINGRCTD